MTAALPLTIRFGVLAANVNQGKRNMAENMKGPSLTDMLQNPKGLAMKRYMATILGQKYLEYEDLINRSTFYLVTDKDMALFGKMISDIYELGYMKAVDDYREQLQKIGVKVNISQKTLADNQKS